MPSDFAPGGFQITLSCTSRTPSQPISAAASRPVRAESTCSASRGSAFQPLQICRVRSSGIAARHPVHLVGTDAGLVAAREERLEPLAELCDHLVVDEPFLDDDEAVALE